MWKTVTGMEINILKEMPCLNVYLQNTFYCILRITKNRLSLREKNKVYLYLFCRANVRNRCITFKAEKNHFALLQGNTVNVFCLYSTRVGCLVPSADRIFFSPAKVARFSSNSFILCVFQFISFFTEKALKCLHSVLSLEKVLFGYRKLLKAQLEKQNTTFPI